MQEIGGLVGAETKGGACGVRTRAAWAHGLHHKPRNKAPIVLLGPGGVSEHGTRHVCSPNALPPLAAISGSTRAAVAGLSATVVVVVIKKGVVVCPDTRMKAGQLDTSTFMARGYTIPSITGDANISFLSLPCSDVRTLR